MDARDFVPNIICVREKITHDDISIESLKAVFTTHKYSSKKQKIWRLELNGKELTKHSPYRWSYKCLTCQKVNEVCMTQILRKLNGNIHNCYSCINRAVSKVDKQRQKMLGNEFARGVKKYVGDEIILSNKEIIRKSIQEFERMDDEYQNEYFKSHLTNDDYNHIKPHIVSIRNGHIKGDEFQKLVYVPVFKVDNQMKFSYVLYNEDDDVILKADQPIFKCQECELEWRGKSIATHKNRLKIICQSCKLCRDTFKIRHIRNIIDQKISYQSKLELKFVKWCADNSIIVENGPSLKYLFQEKIHEYKVDFYLPTFNFLIELKDNHIWHKRQIESGKWKAKISGVKSSLVKNGGEYDEYLLIYPKNWVSIIKYILKCQCKI